MRCLPVLSSLAFSWSLGTALDAPAFHPAMDSDVTKTFTMSAAFQLDDFSLDVDGQDMGAMMGAFELSLDAETAVTVRDTYLATAQGRPERLKRAFDALKSSSTFSIVAGGESQEQPFEASSKLEGRTVSFTWNEQEGAFDVAFEGEEGDTDLLDGLDEEMDLRFFLPQGDVSVGDTWEVAVDSLLPLVMPGGDLAFESPEDADDEAAQMIEEFLEGKAEELKDLLHGTCTCTYKGSSEVGGVQLGEIQIALEIASAADLSPLIEEAIQRIAEENGETEVPVDVRAADVNLDVQGTGTLLWDLRAGRLHSLQMQGDCQIALDVSISVDENGQSHSANLSAELSGTLEETVEASE